MIDPHLTTTTFDLPGYRVVRTIGIVRGIVVRSRSIFGTFGAAMQTLRGGNITLFREMCERARYDALQECLRDAGEAGANAIVGIRYDATELMQGTTEVLCYGTGVVVEPLAP